VRGVRGAGAGPCGAGSCAQCIPVYLTGTVASRDWGCSSRSLAEAHRAARAPGLEATRAVVGVPIVPQARAACRAADGDSCSRPGQQAGRRAAAAGQPCRCASSAASRGVTSAPPLARTGQPARAGVALGGPSGPGLPRDATQCSNARLCRQYACGVASGSQLPGCPPGSCGCRAGEGLCCLAALRQRGTRAGCASFWQPHAGPVPRLPAKPGGRGRTGAEAMGQVAAAHPGSHRASKIIPLRYVVYLGRGICCFVCSHQRSCCFSVPEPAVCTM